MPTENTKYGPSTGQSTIRDIYRKTPACSMAWLGLENIRLTKTSNPVGVASQRNEA